MMALQDLHNLALEQNAPWEEDLADLKKLPLSNWVLRVTVNYTGGYGDALVVTRPVFMTPTGDIGVRGLATNKTMNVRRAVGGGGLLELDKWLGPKIAHEDLPVLPIYVEVQKGG